MDHDLFKEQIDYFLSGFSVITIDLPSHGLSTPYSNFSLEDSAEVVIQILDIENIGQTNLVGQSMGGYVAQLIALNHADRVRTLSVVGSSPLQQKYYSKSVDIELFISRFLVGLIPYDLLIKSLVKEVAITDIGQAYASETLRNGTKAQLTDVMRKIHKYLRTFRGDPTLQIPVLITYGDLEKNARIKSACGKWADFENRELKIIGNAAHNANLDNPYMFNETLSAFLSNNESNRGGYESQ
jgi:pimeloyl-ACP methyl ester carboxylesterase